MPTRFIQRRAALAPNDTSLANANAVFVDSDDDQLKFTTGASGTTTVDVVTETQTQTLTNKTVDLASNTLATTSAQLRAALTDESGTGAALFAGGAIGAATGTSLAVTGALSSSSASAGIGYATGAGGAVTQITSRTTGVTVNTISGAITTDTSSLAAEASADFVVTNSSVAIGDVVVVSERSGSNGGGTIVSVVGVAAGSFTIQVHNGNVAVGTAETGAIIINFAVIKAVSA